MTASFLDVAQSIDRLYPPQSMRELAQRFRYADVVPGVFPPGGVSLRTLSARVNGETSKKLEFLHYNTWLIRDDFKFSDIVKIYYGGWQHFVVCLELSYVNILAGVFRKIDTSGICDILFPREWSVCGVLDAPLWLACKAIGEAGEIAAFVIEKCGDCIDWIFDVLAVPVNIIADVIGELLGIIIPIEIHLKDAPDLDARVLEIGNQMFKYDFISLCEVWRQEHKDALLSRPVPYLTGPGDPAPGEWEHMGSGLLVFSPRFMIENGGVYLYQNKGVSSVRSPSVGGCDFSKIVDSDEWARKGIQRTLVDVGFGYIEVYSTHLYSGGELLEGVMAAPFGGKVTDDEKKAVRQAQINELAQFIAQTHVDEYVAIVVGDFNVQDAERYATLTPRTGIFDNLKNIANRGLVFYDWYEQIDPNYRAKPDEYRSGNTCRWNAENDIYFGFCADYFSDGKHEELRPGSCHYDYYCAENDKVYDDENGQVYDCRIDYIFVQKPVMSHSFNLDVSRIRRRVFKRPGSPEGQQFMSDHIGLEVTLFVSPK